MTEKRFTVHIRWYNYEKTEGEIELKDNGQPLLISESVEDVKYLKEMLNELNDENEQLKKDATTLIYANQEYRYENEQLKQQLQKIEDDFEVEWTQNYEEINKDKLHIKDKNTKILLDSTNLFIEVYIPQINKYYCFKYKITGRSLMREFIENYNSKEDYDD